MKKLLFIICLLIHAYSMIAQESILQQKVSIQLKQVSMEKAVEAIANKVGVNVSYSSILLSDCQKVTIEAQNEALITLLNRLLLPCNVSYTVHAGQLILIPKRNLNVKEYTIKGTFFNETTREPVAYAILQLEGKSKGVVADHEGFFEITLNEVELMSNIVASCIGFERKIIIPDSLISNPEIIIQLKEKYIDLDLITITSVRPSKNIKKWGNSSRSNKGSLYLDTHGQQIALFVENKKQDRGYIKNISYYLSKDGNVEAPFRVRIMDADTLKDSPGKDLVTDILIAHPPSETNGWYEVDLSEYNIMIPEEGFFLGLQGIYPNDFSSFESNAELIDKLPETSSQKKQYIPKSIHYGQRIGHSGKKGEKTWHYSLSHQWFQLEKDNYNVKISTQVGLY